MITVITGKMLYAKKATWHAVYRIDLQRLINELEFTESLIVDKKYIALQEKKKGERVSGLFKF